MLNYQRVPRSFPDKNRYVSKFLMVQSHFFDGYPPVKERCGTPIIRWFSGRGNHWFFHIFVYVLPQVIPLYQSLEIPMKIGINPNETRWNPYEISIFLSLSHHFPMVFLSLSHGFSSFCQDVAPQTSTSEGPKNQRRTTLATRQEHLGRCAWWARWAHDGHWSHNKNSGISPNKMVPSGKLT